jgi:hypothetical protein
LRCQTGMVSRLARVRDLSASRFRPKTLADILGVVEPPVGSERLANPLHERLGVRMTRPGFRSAQAVRRRPTAANPAANLLSKDVFPPPGTHSAAGIPF